eukprot:gene15366-3177_t
MVAEHVLWLYLYSGNEEESGPNELSLGAAGLTATLFGLMNLFARSSGGYLG